MQPTEGRKKMRIAIANGSRNRNQRSLDGRFETDAMLIKSTIGWEEQNRLKRV